MTFWKARVETRNFVFEAYGATEAEAWRLLEDAWSVHAKHTQASIPWRILAEDIVVTEMQLGAAYRDGERMEDVA